MLKILFQLLNVEFSRPSKYPKNELLTQTLGVPKIELINLVVPLQLLNSIYKDYEYLSFSELDGYFNCLQAISL